MFAKSLDDYISEPNIVGRIGGEEFLALLVDEKIKDIAGFCEKLREIIKAETVEYQNNKINITFSGGIAYTTESRNASDLVNKADERLYEAKKSGRDQIV